MGIGVIRIWFSFAIVLGLVACGGGSGGAPVGNSGGESEPGTVSPAPGDVRALAFSRGVGLPEPPGLTGVTPSESALVDLGMQLFFSRTLSGNFDTACASCHHPELAGGDGLSLPVGVAARRPSLLGSGREVNPDLDLDPAADGGPNVPRNSPTIFNAALYERMILHDGRVFVLDATETPPLIRTPDSGLGADTSAGRDLLEAQSVFPLTANNEMRGFAYPELADPDSYRSRLLDRLRGTVDVDAGEPTRWANLFQNAFGDTVIDESRLRKALAAYQASLTMVDSPWSEFLAGDDFAISEVAKEGARLFLLSIGEGGLGCVACHSGEKFSNEAFYNVGFPQIGRGKRPDQRDLGRWQVNTAMQTENNLYAFRVPSLLNVEFTSPYGHAGAFGSLEDTLVYHADPRAQVEVFDFSLLQLRQLSGIGTLYENSERYTRLAINASSFGVAETLLPRRPLSQEEVRRLIAFLESLTDPCAAESSCVSAWVPVAASDPDGNLLVRNLDFSVDYSATESGGAASTPVEFVFGPAPNRSVFPELQDCGVNLSAFNTGEFAFQRRDFDLGLTAPHGFDLTTWLGGTEGSTLYMDATMIAGGITAGYLTGSCWPDLIFAGGDHGGMVIFRNEGGQTGFVPVDAFLDQPGTRYTGVALADLDGDYNREMLFGNLHGGNVPVYSPGIDGKYYRAAELPMGRNTFGISFGDWNGDQYLDAYFGHWSMVGQPGTAAAFWKNNGGKGLVPADAEAGTTSGDVPQQFNFTPGFVDFTRNGFQDLVIASDFNTSSTLMNKSGGEYVNVTVPEVIDDRNGMGSVIADFDNDGMQDWFVTSIYSETGSADGNRLYRNISSNNELVFENRSEEAGIRKGWWGWGTCGADFNNDGYVDIFHVNGYTNYPAALSSILDTDWLQGYSYWFFNRDTPAVLYMNNGDGTFSEQASDWGIDTHADGRGITCFDYDRDGDVDVALVDHSEGIQFFENQAGSESDRRFLNVRVVGAPPNTDAIGARVSVEAKPGAETQNLLRVVQGNSNFNSQNLPDLHFGLGAATVVDRLEVEWPDGQTLICRNIPVNRFLVFDQREPVCPAS